MECTLQLYGAARGVLINEERGARQLDTELNQNTIQPAGQHQQQIYASSQPVADRQVFFPHNASQVYVMFIIIMKNEEEQEGKLRQGEEANDIHLRF